MDKDKLEAKLTEVAEWCYPSISEATTIERITPTTGRKDYVQTFTPNPQLGPRIVKFKDTISLKPCAWCNKIVNQTTTHRRLIEKGEFTTWHHECTTCQRIYNSKTGELTHKNSKKGKEEVKKIAWYNDPNWKG